MKIETSWISQKSGKVVTGYYEESDDFSNLPQQKIWSVCAFCYYDGKIVMVKNEGHWEPVAGHVESGETPDEALIREVKEESNMKILKYFPLGFHYTHNEDRYQARYFCIVEPYGPFVSDPDGGVTEIKLIKTRDISESIEWNGTDVLIAQKCQKILGRLGLE
jgi:ADP-ribose pyrophosphatase YjhB (NUDIX family)